MPGVTARRRRSRRHENHHPTQKSGRPASTTNRMHLAGLIMWLPRRDGLRNHSELPSGCYEHPVVILSPRASTADKVVILILTSFGETDILAKFPTNPRVRRAYLPIHPASPHPDTALQLHLQKPAVLRRKTYVNTREKHTVPLAILRAYDRQDLKTRYALTRDSYKQLIHHAGFAAPACAEPSCGASHDEHDGVGDDIASSAPTSAPCAREPSPVPQLTRPVTPPHLTSGTVLPPPPRPSGPTPAPPRPADGFSHIPPGLAPRAAPYPLPRDTLPRYHSHARPRSDGIGIGHAIKWVLALIFCAVVFGAVFFGLWSAWAHGAELGRELLRCVGWLGFNAFRLAGAAVRGVARGAVWLAEQVAALAVRTWAWLTGGGGGGVHGMLV
ncbi:hypothetical protein MFIFM68171_07400 [Madurella fahalii]|uniref:Uncharacterized protein n=1 Tax=Madurella fahalii TaxID=1157608 RepID=A0ABQ0GI17_9PEZI